MGLELKPDPLPCAKLRCAGGEMDSLKALADEVFQEVFLPVV